MTRRERIAAKYGNRCMYCGKPLPPRWHEDHIAPIYRGRKDKPERAGTDTEDNEGPACPRCNRRKSVLTVEEFRGEIAAQVERLRRDSAAFRIAEDFGLIQVTEKPVTFLFEREAKK